MTKKALLTVLLLSSTTVLMGQVRAETLDGALAKAYSYNRQLNSERAQARIVDEDIAIAKSAFLPQISGFGSYGRSRSNTTVGYTNVGTLGVQLSQKVFDGFITYNNVMSAETKAAAQREYLRNSEQNQLITAVQAYADVYQYRRIAQLRKENLAALEEQVRADRAKLEVGEGTRTDLAQSEAARSVARSLLSIATADLKSSEATYRQVVGAFPESLSRPASSEGLPTDYDEGLAHGLETHPAIRYSSYLVDSSGYNVRAKKGQLLPQVDFSASAQYNEIYDGPGVNGRTNSVGLNLTIPIYTGGRTSAQIRQSKEQLGQAEILLDLARDQVRQQFADAWAQFEGARASVAAYRDSVRAAEIALDGRIQENRVGQATTLDVLNSRTQLIDAQISLVAAERNVVLASYNLRMAVGGMTADGLNLQVKRYNAEDHTRAVRNKFIGIRTPDGR